MRYSINFDRLINTITPPFLRTKSYVLFLQSLVSPLSDLNKDFVKFTSEHKIESHMTSQVILFEWYLNHKFKKYFVDKNDTIILEDAADIGVPVYRKDDPNQVPYTIWGVNDDWSGLKGTDEEPPIFYYRTENKSISETSFTVLVPKITIPQEEFVAMISSVVNTYKIAGKTFRIKITETL